MYKVKKQNILMMIKFLINQELQNFHNNEIDNKYSKVGEGFIVGDDLKKARISERIVHWNSLVKKSFDYVVNKPSKGVLRTRLKLFKQTPDCTEVMYENIIDALKGYLEVSNLGSSEAFIDLMNSKLAKTDDVNTFKWNKEISQLEALFNKLKAEGLISKESNLKQWKKAFRGGLLTDVEQIKFAVTNALVVYMFDVMNKQRLIRYGLKHNKVIEVITGITSVAQTRDKYQNSKTGLPKGSDDVNLILSNKWSSTVPRIKSFILNTAYTIPVKVSEEFASFE